jgi:hypothetical protein
LSGGSNWWRRGGRHCPRPAATAGDPNSDPGERPEQHRPDREGPGCSAPGADSSRTPWARTRLGPGPPRPPDRLRPRSPGGPPLLVLRVVQYRRASGTHRTWPRSAAAARPDDPSPPGGSAVTEPARLYAPMISDVRRAAIPAAFLPCRCSNSHQPPRVL